MAYSFQPLDQALDSLGKSYVDGVTVKIASKYRVDCDLEQVKNILKTPGPSVLSFENSYDTSYEKKVLEDFQKRKVDQENKNKEKKERIEKYKTEKAEKLANKQKEEEERALEDERKLLLEIEAEKKAKTAEEEKMQLEDLKIKEEKALQIKVEEEAEWKRFEEERLENVKPVVNDTTIVPAVSADTSEEEAVNEAFATPPEETEKLSNTEIQVKGTQSAQTAQNLQINFSDFEALSDPFADLELKSINDLAELQTILSSSHMSAPPPGQAQFFTSTSSSTASHQSQQALHSQANNQPLRSHASQNPGHYQQPSNFYSNIPRQSMSQAVNQNLLNNLPSHLAQPQPGQTNFANFSGFNSNPPGYNFPTPPCTTTAYNHQTPVSTVSPYYPLGYTSSSTNSTPGIVSSSTNTGYSVYNPGQLTSSQGGKGGRSISSDRRTEKLKDSSDNYSNTNTSTSGELKPSRSVGDMITQLQKEAQALQEQKRKSPNPNSRPGSRGATGLENWTPWPKLDQEQYHAPAAEEEAATVDESCLKDLLDDEANMCRQLHEMGFPLSRLAKGCQAVGANSQKLINFCLVVDRLVDEGFSIDDSEEVAMLHNAEEDVCRKHLKSFQQLAEIGFPSKDVHQALIASSFDHQKALEQLIG